MYDKLVRDNIPSIIRENNEIPVTYIADDEEYQERLRAKLIEEAKEYSESGDLEELADIIEVINAIKKFEDISDSELQKVRKDKNERRGCFEKRIILESVDQDN